jgi:hypothetical protein
MLAHSKAEQQSEHSVRCAFASCVKLSHLRKRRKAAEREMTLKKVPSDVMARGSNRTIEFALYSLIVWQSRTRRLLIGRLPRAKMLVAEQRRGLRVNIRLSMADCSKLIIISNLSYCI